MINTLRILISWQCNLKCSYCCNEQERFRKDIIPTKIDEIKWNNYENFCLSGGEPLMNLNLLQDVLNRIPADKMIVLYTNGILLTNQIAIRLAMLGVKAVNVGLHHPSTYSNLIKKIVQCTANTDLSVRFHAQDIYEKELTSQFPAVSFRFWKMNDCDRANEHRIILV